MRLNGYFSETLWGGPGKDLRFIYDFFTQLQCIHSGRCYEIAIHVFIDVNVNTMILQFKLGA